MNSIELRSWDSIDDIDGQDWAKLTSSAVFSSSGWIRTVSTYRRDKPKVRIHTASSNDRVLAAMILCHVTHVTDDADFLSKLFGGRHWLKNIAERKILPCVTAGSPSGYGGSLVTAPDLDRDMRDYCAERLVRFAESACQEEGLALWFPDVLDQDMMLSRLLDERGYLRTRYLPLAEMAVPWASFDEYVDEMRRKHKNVAKDIRRERNRCAAAGISFDEPKNLAKRDEKFVRMANATHAKYGAAGFAFSAGVFDALQKALGDRLLVCSAERNGSSIGFATMLADSDTLWAESYGLDYSDADSAFVYFNLAFQWPIRKAIELGIRHIVFGRGQYRLKVRRGCTLTDTYIRYKPGSAIARLVASPYFHILDRHYSKQAYGGIVERKIK